MLFRPYSNVSAQPQSFHTLILISHLCCRLTPQMLALGLFLHSTTGMGGTSYCLCKLHPISQRERNYSTMEKEALAVVTTMKHFRVYLLGRKFHVITDSMITSMAFEKPGLLVIFLLMLSMSGPLL